MDNLKKERKLCSSCQQGQQFDCVYSPVIGFGIFGMPPGIQSPNTITIDVSVYSSKSNYKSQIIIRTTHERLCINIEYTQKHLANFAKKLSNEAHVDILSRPNQLRVFINRIWILLSGWPNSMEKMGWAQVSCRNQSFFFTRAHAVLSIILYLSQVGNRFSKCYHSTEILQTPRYVHEHKPVWVKA